MSTLISALLNINPDAPHFRDPRRLQRFVSDQASLRFSNNAASAAGFWTAWDFAGDYLDSNWSANTYQTVVNVATGAGFLGAVVGPVMANATDTTTFRITVDGTEYTITVDAFNANDRGGLGFPAMTDIFTTPNNFDTPNNARLNTGDAGLLALDTNAHLLPVFHSLFLGQGLLKFRTSLLVEIKQTSAQSNTASQERKAGVLYQLMGA